MAVHIAGAVVVAASPTPTSATGAPGLAGRRDDDVA
jgi:hypothetical protein